MELMLVTLRTPLGTGGDTFTSFVGVPGDIDVIILGKQTRRKQLHVDVTCEMRVKTEHHTKKTAVIVVHHICA